MDTVVYLQRTMKVKPAQISWVIPNDVWILKREGSGGPWSWPQALLEHNQDKRKASLALEKKGVLVRIDPKIEPTKFRFPVVGMDELKYMRLVTNIIRRGRVTGITKEQRGRTGKVVVAFGKDHEEWTPDPEAVDDNDLVFVHCTSPGPFNGNTVSDVFASEHQLNLNLLFAPPVPISMSVIAYIEFARINKTLDLAFGRRLEESLRGGNKSFVVEEHAPIVDESEDISGNEVVRLLIKGIVLQSDDDDDEARGSFQSILNLALFLALADTDPMVGFQFLKENRLSFFSIPGFKGGVYESLGMMMERAQTLGFTDNERCMIELVREKLQVLEGK